MPIYFTTLDGTGTVLAILCMAILFSLLFNRFRLPCEIGMLPFGLFIAAILYANDAAISANLLRLDRNTVLYAVLPTLFFACAIRQDPVSMQKNLPGILLLAIPGVLFSVLLTGGILTFLTPFSPVTALLFGALISVPDPLAAHSLAGALPLPRKVQALLDGESLLGSATAVSLFAIILSINSREASSGPMPDILFFIWHLIGGFLFGAAAAALFSKIIRQMKNDHTQSTLLSILLVYATCFAAERFFHTSGIMAVSAAGLICRRTAFSNESGDALLFFRNFWSLAAFFAAGAVFLLIGFAEQDLFLSENWSRTAAAILCAVTAALAARAFSIAGNSSLFSVFGSTEPIGTMDKTLLFAGGARGFLPLALLYCIPADHPDRLILVQAVLAVILFTMPLSCLTVRRLLKRFYPADGK